MGRTALSKLQTLRSQSQTSIIHLNDNLLYRLLTETSRPFSLLIFFDATQLHDKPKLHLLSLKFEFAILANSFITNNKESPNLSKLLFAVTEFGESQSTFHQFGVYSLSHICLIGPSDQDLKNDSVKMGACDLSCLAESMVEFVQSKVSLDVGLIHKPPIVSKNKLGFIIVAFLIWVSFMVKKLVLGDTNLHDWKVWTSRAVFVYFFSVSETMHNIIRKMSMFLSDKNDPNKLVFFYVLGEWNAVGS